MSLENFISSEVMSALIVERLKTQLVAGDVVNTQYAGTIANAGSSVTIPSLEDFDVSTYTKNSTITYSSLDSSSVTMYVDQYKHFSFSVDKIDDDRANRNLIPVIQEQGAHKLSKAADTYILQTVMSEGAGITGGSSARALGTTSTPIEVGSDTTSSGVLSYIGRMSQRLDENDVPQDGRFLVVPPFIHNQLTINKVLEVRGTDNEQLYQNGRVGRVNGFDVRVSNNVTNASAAKAEIFAGHMASVAFVDKLIDFNILPTMQDTFGIGVRGLYIYGAKVVQANALAKGIITQR